MEFTGEKYLREYAKINTEFKTLGLTPITRLTETERLGLGARLNLYLIPYRRKVFS